MPDIRPFRALRYDSATIADPALVVAPPYDVIDAAEQDRLLARHPANVVRLDLPREEPGDEPDDRYRRAARTLAGWRSDGTLHKDPHPSIYVYEQTYRVPGTDVARTQRGFFARLRLEAFGAGSGVLPHERTLTGPREDRYKLLRATGVNSSPIVGLYDDRGGAGRLVLEAATTRAADLDIIDDDAVRHRLWAVPADGDATATVAPLLAAAAAGPVTIADGHHRYETALRYRDERRMSRSCEEDPAFDYVLALLLDTTAQSLTILPTHRIVRRLGDDGVADLLARLGELFEVRDATEETLRDQFEAGAVASGGEGRFGLWTRAGGALLTARREVIEPFLPDGGTALRALDVTLLGAALERLVAIDADALVAGAVAYTKSAAEAVESVDAGIDGSDAAFLLEPTPVASVLAVAADGDVMPQKSTYFYPKALTGLVINPHEW
ncbi:MAG: hypothetical protein A2Z32_08725 [Chloroflexi bacterium RBG_16_69_14]|nr:MAG: hypothetical protein A2Z32_08725 [Chloroflexi bacterium RBG_16_69_14]